MIADSKTIQDLLDPNTQVLKKEGERFFFVDPATDIVPDEKMDEENPKHWSIARELSFGFIEGEMNTVLQGALVLDVGMGKAQFRRIYSDKLVIGADHYPYSDVRVVCDFTRPLPFKDGVFDVVMASNVLEHLPNPEGALKEYHRVLRPGGRMIVAVPFLLGVHQAPYDFYRYTHFALERLGADAGFSLSKASILGTGYDTYIQLQKKFFTLMLDSKDRQKTFIGKLTIWVLVKSAWILQLILNLLLSPLFGRVGKTMKLPLMYGMVSVK